MRSSFGRANGRQLARDGPRRESLAPRFAEECADDAPVDFGPFEVVAAQVDACEFLEVEEIAAVGGDGVGGQVAGSREVFEEAGDFGGHGVGAAAEAGMEAGLGAEAGMEPATGAEVGMRFSASIHWRKDRSARSAMASRLSAFLRGASGMGSTSPQFEFMGWKSPGSASRRYR